MALRVVHVHHIIIGERVPLSVTIKLTTIRSATRTPPNNVYSERNENHKIKSGQKAATSYFCRRTPSEQIYKVQFESTHLTTVLSRVHCFGVQSVVTRVLVSVAHKSSSFSTRHRQHSQYYGLSPLLQRHCNSFLVHLMISRSAQPVAKVAFVINTRSDSGIILL